MIRREVTAEGRSRAWINGSPTTIGVLAALGETLVDLHGQHQTVQLLDAAMQRDLLDAYADSCRRSRPPSGAAHVALAALRADEQRLLCPPRRGVPPRRLASASWSQEIDAARLQPGEEEGLDRESIRLGAGGHPRRAGAPASSHRSMTTRPGARRPSLGPSAHCTRSSASTPRRAAWRELLDAAFAQLDELARRGRAVRRWPGRGSGPARPGRAPARSNRRLEAQARRDTRGRAADRDARAPNSTCLTPLISTCARWRADIIGAERALAPSRPPS